MPNKKTIKKFSYFIAIAASIFFLLSKTDIAIAKENLKNTGKPKKTEEIHVTADRLISDRNAQYAEFTGNVVVTSSDSVLTSDRVKIIYSDKKEKDKQNSQSGAIDQIIATGNVIITFEDKIAASEKAVYNATDDTIILTGKKPKVTSGKSFISGEQITLNRKSGKVFVDSGNSTRVKAEFHPDGKGLKKPKKDD